MTLFDAVCGDAYGAVENILLSAPIKLNELRAILNGYMTPDGAIEAEEKLRDGSWPVLTETDKGTYASALPKLSVLPLTALQKRWLRTMADDPRAPLFLTDAQLDRLRTELAGVPPLYSGDELAVFDGSGAGDDFADPGYRARFRTILEAFREGRALSIDYVSYKGKTLRLRFTPERLEYSEKDRRFRLHGYVSGGAMTLNLSGLRSVAPGAEAEPLPANASQLCGEPLTVEVGDERNALTRFMLEFSCFKKETTIDPETRKATAKIWYPVKDETEVLIRILGFGPNVRVTGPEHFVRRLRERIARQPAI